MEDLIRKIALTKIPLVGPIIAKNLISYTGGIEAVFSNSQKALEKIPGVGPQIAKNILRQSTFAEAEKECQYIAANHIQALYYLDDNYPRRLKPLSDAPILLYYKGSADLNANRILSIVGTRQPSREGRINCQKIIQELTPYQPLIVSGLAFGIDITAHQTALESDIPNIGVLAHGLATIYPSQHHSTAQKILTCGGLLSEYSSQTEPEREYFPMRNRIIAGICDALLVIETNIKGGSMISAYAAAAYHKDIFALPGRPTDLRSKGCNHLIKTHQAGLIENANDLAYAMGWDNLPEKPGVQKELFVELSGDEKIIVDLLRESTELGFETLLLHSGMTNSQLAAILLQLEFQGLIQMLPGKLYALVR